MANMSRFAPPPERFGWGSMGMALLAHGLLIAALTWGTSWRSQQNAITTASAELWAALPAQAAPPPEAVLAPEPIPEPPAAKVTAAVPAKAPTKTPIEAPIKASDIVTTKIKPDPKSKEKAAKRKETEAERVREQVRQDQIKRMAGMAGATGATGSTSSTGQALQSAAPSDSYSGRVKDRVKPHIIFPNVDSLPSNAAVEILIRLAPDGTVVLPLTISKSSGNAAFDRAVLRGIEKTETLPRDKDGRFPGPFTLVWRPRE